MYCEKTSDKPERFAIHELSRKDMEMLNIGLTEARVNVFEDYETFADERAQTIEIYKKIDAELTATKTPRAAKTLPAILILILLSITAFSSNYGYHVIITDPSNCKSQVINTPSTTEVEKLFTDATDIVLPIKKLMPSSSVFFEYRNLSIEFYCEKKRIVRHNGKLRYRTIHGNELRRMKKSIIAHQGGTI